MPKRNILCMKVKNYNKALNSYEECIKINTNDFNLHKNKAELLKSLEDMKRL